MTTNDFRGKPMRIKFTTLIIAAAVLLAAAIGLCSCGQTYYEEMDEKGYTVSVSYDPNGGTFSSTNSVITDVFDPSKCEKDENGNAVISLVDPSSPVRDKTNPLTVAKPGYFLAGWYAERELKNPDDPDGGYIYGKKWDFENDTLVLDGDKTYTSAENVLTLYAAWIPNFEFNFYRENENGEWVKYATPATNSVIDVPEWKNGDSTIKMGRFPALDGYTFVAAYADPECEQQLTGRLTAEWDVETATVESSVINVYTKWLEGNRYRIYKAADLASCAAIDGYYELYDDIDFTGRSWPAKFRTGKFSGTFIGNGYTISGISMSSTSRSNVNNGIFASIDKSAVFENITFEITHTVNLGLTANDARFGTLAGTVVEGAIFNNVVLKPTLLIGNDCKELIGKDNYNIHLIAGNLNVGTLTGLTVVSPVCAPADEQTPKVSVKYDSETLQVSISVPTAD